MDKKMKPRQIVMMDMDGVVSDFYGPATQYLHDWYGSPAKAIPSKDAFCWGFEQLGITKEQDAEFWTRLSGVTNFWAELPEFEPGVVQRVWREIGDCVNEDFVRTIYFCTTRQATEGWSVEDQSENWLRWMGWKDNPHVIVTKHKGLVAKALKAAYFIDDKASNVIDVMKESPNTHSFFLLRKYQEDELDNVIKAQEETNANLSIVRGSLTPFLKAVKHGA